MIRTAIVCLCLYAFVALATYAYKKHQPYDIDGLNKLSANALTHKQAKEIVELYDH